MITKRQNWIFVLGYVIDTDRNTALPIECIFDNGTLVSFTSWDVEHFKTSCSPFYLKFKLKT